MIDAIKLVREMKCFENSSIDWNDIIKDFDAILASINENIRIAYDLGAGEEGATPAIELNHKEWLVMKIHIGYKTTRPSGHVNENEMIINSPHGRVCLRRMPDDG